MEKEEAITIIINTIRDLQQIKPRSTAIRAEHVKGLIIEECKFTGFDTALDIREGEEISLRKNILENYDQSSGLLSLLEQFLAEATNGKKQVNKTILGKIKEQILNRWPEIIGTTLFLALMRIIK